MYILLTGFGTLKPHAPIPDDILASAYPFIGATPHDDGAVFLHLTPYPEVYNEDNVRRFLENLRPYLDAGHLDIRMQFRTSADPHYYEAICSTAHWAYDLEGGKWFRKEYGTGSGTWITCISE